MIKKTKNVLVPTNPNFKKLRAFAIKLDPCSYGFFCVQVTSRNLIPIPHSKINNSGQSYRLYFYGEKYSLTRQVFKFPVIGPSKSLAKLWFGKKNIIFSIK